MSNGYIAVDLDGTLAEYDEWRGPTHIGKPIPKMVSRVMHWLAHGKTVKIFTARVSMGQDADGSITKTVQDWLERECGLPRLAVTNVKDYDMIECWDDRSVQVIPNTGEAMDGRLI